MNEENVGAVGVAAPEGGAGAHVVNPYGTYAPAMAPVPGDPMAAEWHTNDGDKIAAATGDEALDAFASSPKAASSLLDGVRGAYATDALVAARIAAVTAHVTRPGAPAAASKIWTRALIARAESSDDAYVKTFCLGQLEICAPRELAGTIRRIGEKANDRAVASYAVAVARSVELF